MPPPPQPWYSSAYSSIPALASGTACFCVCREREGDKRLKAPLQNKTLLFGPWSLSGNGLWSHRTRKGLIADKIVSVFEELVLFTGLKIFTAQSKRRPRGEGNVSLGIKTLASPIEARTVGVRAAHYLGGCRTVAARWGRGTGNDSGVHVTDKGSDLDKQLGECWAGGQLSSLI